MRGHIRIAVCTNRAASAVGESLSALGAQAPAGAVAVVTSGLDSASVEGHRRAFEGPVLVEPRPGLSLARNRALQWCEEGDVLAFVDDDAVVCEGWYEALRRRWEEAEEDVACVGGPIRPRWPEGGPPAWVSPALLPALTLLDLGEEVRDLDPNVTTVYGANVSFRAGPLRSAGGFDPGFGHSGGRIFFSEEDEAERALARLGYRIRYVPDAGVEHVIPPARLTRRSFVRRRFAYGRALGVRRARPLAPALRQAITSAIGALAAAISRDDALTMERAVRSAENLGVLAGRIRA